MNSDQIGVAPILADDEMAIGGQAQVEPLASPSLASLMMGCPRAWGGDTGFLEWCTSLYNQGLKSVPQTTPPALTTIQPNFVRNNTTPTISLGGTGFDPATVKVQIIATQITPTPTPTTTALSAVISPASLLGTRGSVVQVSVVNGSGAISNALNLYVD
jgi:hypothetical protein